MYPRGRKWSLETGSDPGFSLIQGVCKPLEGSFKSLVIFLADSPPNYLQVLRAGWVSMSVAPAAINGDSSWMRGV